MKKKRISELMFPEKFKERADRVRKLMVRGDFVKRDPSGNFKFIVCRMCGTTIADWVTDKTDQRKIENGPIVQQHYMKFCHLNNFRKVNLKLTDGGGHSTNMCTDCAHKLDDQDEDILDAVYVSDYEAFARVDQRDGKTKKEFAIRSERGLGLGFVKGSKKVIEPGGDD